MSTFETGSHAFPFGTSNPNQDELQTQLDLKNEVGIVRGFRQTMKIEDDYNWDEVGGGDSGTKVVKMHGSIFHGHKKLGKEADENSATKRDMIFMLKGFCIQHGIPVLPEDVGQEQTGDGADGGEQRKTGSQTTQAPVQKGRESGSGGPVDGNPRRKRRTWSSGGGAGGGKRPEPPPSSSEPESAWTTTVSESEPRTSSTASSKVQRSEGRKKRTIETVPVVEVSKSSLSKPKPASMSKVRNKLKVSMIEEKPFNEENGNFPTEFKHQQQHPVEANRRSSYRKQLKNRGTLLKPDNEGSVSGPVLITNLDDTVLPRLTQKELDSEWLLKWTSSEDSGLDEDNGAAGKATQKEYPIQQDLQAFMKSTTVLDRINSLIGLNPYTKVVRSNQCVQVKWVPKSGEYIGVCLNAFVFFITTLSILCTSVIILGYKDPLTTTKQIINIDFSHHFLEGMFVMLVALFLCIWTVSCILELGVHYAEFYSRFNMGIVLTKYDVSQGIHEMIVKHLATVAIFLFLLLLLFFEGYVHNSIVRESCGYIGFAILRPFNFVLRESKYYPLVELFGLIILLYTFLSLNLVLLHFAVYAKALGNMAKTFNLRMAYVFGSLSERREKGEPKVIRKVIPFKKLWAEHQIITSLFRHISQVNSVVFTAFIFSMVCEIVLNMWLFFDLFLEVHPPHLEGIKLERSGSAVLAVPLRLQKANRERLLKAGVFFAITWSTYWVFGGVMHNAGDALHVGMEYVRRHGFVQGQNSKERRFVLSMFNSFTPKRPYWIGRTFQFQKIFFVALVSFVIGASMVTVAFRPDRIRLISIETCDELGFCTVIKLHRYAEHIVYVSLDISPPFRTTTKKTTIPTRVTQSPTDVTLDERYPFNSFFDSPPCKSGGFHPLIESVVAETVSAEWPAPFSRLKLPYLFKRKSIQQYILYGAQSIMHPLDHPLTDCYGENLANTRAMDDCNSLSFATPKHGDLAANVGTPAEIQLIAVNQIPGYPDPVDERFFCCHKYAISSENEVKVCNMPRKNELDDRCNLSALASPEISRFVQKLKEKRRAGGNTRDDLAFGVPFSDPVRMSWTKCLCDKISSECEKASPTTTTTPTTTLKTTTTTLTTTSKTTTTIPTTTSKTTTSKPTTTSKTTTTLTTTIGPPSRCFDLPPGTPDGEKYFTKCKYLGNQKLPYIEYPTIFQKNTQGVFEQRFKLKKDCDPDFNGKRLTPPVLDSVDFSRTVYDCQKNNFNPSADEYFEDECRNPIFSKLGTRWWDPIIRIVILNKNRVACCVDYQLTDSIQSRRQTMVCHNVRKSDEFCDDKPDKLRASLIDLFYEKYFKANEEIQTECESGISIVSCMCQTVPYVRWMITLEPPLEAHVKKCKDHINSCFG